MRFLKVLCAVLCLSSPALAQTGTATSHAFLIGKGAGVTGYTSLLCASAQLAVGQAAADPICRTLTGDVTIDAAGVTAIGANKVQDTMMRPSGALALIGRSANSTGNVADIAAIAGSGCAFRESGNTVGCGTLATAAYAANSVTNAKLAQMTNATTKCRTTAGTGDPEDCTATQMRALLSLVIGTNVEAWDTDLDALAALASNGLIARTGSGTVAARTLTAPAAGITVTNGDGVAGNPTLVLANDLAALEGLSTTGIARRTGTDAWSLGTTVSLAEGGTGQGTAVAARASSGLNIESVTTFTNANLSAAITDRVIATTATNFTAARTVTLPALSTYNPGQSVVVVDSGGAINGAFTLTISANGADTINGASTLVIPSQYGGAVLWPIGANKWGYISSSSGSGTVTQVVCGTGLTGGTITTSGTCAIAAGAIETAWSAFTPTLTCGSATFTTTAARSKTYGKTTHIELDFTIATLGTCTNAITFTLPNTPQSGGAFVITMVSAMGACSILPSNTTATCAKSNAASFVAADHWTGSGVYENQ
jgi:hypothetical protein